MSKRRGVTVIFNKAILHFGKDAQKIKCAEELSELSSAILAGVNGRDNENNVCEEIADVEIMLQQMRIVFSTASINKWVERKLCRLDARLIDESGD